MINSERLINTFFELVRIDSPTGGEHEVAAYLTAKLAALGFQTRMDAMLNLTATLPGKGVRPGPGAPILLSAHMDSVPPCHGIQPRIESGIIRSDGTTILGGDDRVGVAAILEAVTVIHERGLLHLPIEIAFTAQEEPGLIGSTALDCSQFRSKRGVVFDYGDPVGKIIVSAPGTWNMDITITGRAAHAGGEPEKGINAIAVAVDAISHFKLGRLDAETTANVGMIQGGVARNVVPETCRVTAETRSRRASKLERQKNIMLAAFERAAENHGARLDMQLKHAYPLFRLSPAAPIVSHVSAALTRIGREPKLNVAGGGSDANVFNSRGIACVVVSMGVENVHTTAECVSVAELIKTAELALEVIRA